MTPKTSRKHHSHRQSSSKTPPSGGRRTSGNDIRQIFGIIATVVIVLGIGAVILFPQLRGNRAPASEETGPAKPGDLVVLAAASLTQPMSEAVKAFEASDSTTTIQLSCASSNFLRRQIERGAPADLFISASAQHVEALREKAWVDAEDISALWTTQLVVIAPASVAGSDSPARDALAVARRVAIGDLGVPVGEYARQALEAMGLKEVLQKKLVPMIDETAVINAVATKSCDRGIAYAAGIDSEQRRSKVRILATIPPADHDDIVYSAAILSDSKHKEAARRFLDFLTTGKGRPILEGAGFLSVALPSAKP